MNSPETTLTDFAGPLIAGSFSLASGLATYPVWAPGYSLRRSISDTSTALAATPSDSVAHKMLLTTLSVYSSRLAAAALVPLKTGAFLFALLTSGGAWVYGVLLSNNALTFFSTMGFIATYVVGLVYFVRVFRLRGRQAAAMLANRTSGFSPLQAGEFRGRAVVTRRLVDRELSIGATIQIVKDRRQRQRTDRVLAPAASDT